MKSADKKQLKAQAHNLKPVVMIGQSGLTKEVLAEIELALNHHELIKIKVRAERDDRQKIRDQICTETCAEYIQSIGQIVVIYRLNPDK